MGRAHEKWHICKCLIFHAKNLLKVYNQKNSGYTKSRRKIRQQKIPKIDSKFLHIELLSREAWTSKDTRFLTLSKGESTATFSVVRPLHHGASAMCLLHSRKIKSPVPISTAYALFPAGSHITHLSGRISPFLV